MGLFFALEGVVSRSEFLDMTSVTAKCWRLVLYTLSLSLLPHRCMRPTKPLCCLQSTWVHSKWGLWCCPFSTQASEPSYSSPRALSISVSHEEKHWQAFARMARCRCLLSGFVNQPGERRAACVITAPASVPLVQWTDVAALFSFLLWLLCSNVFFKMWWGWAYLLQGT